MNKSLIGVILCIGALLCCKPSHAQSATDTLSNLNATVINTRDNFYKAIGGESWLYNGKQYDYYNPTIRGNPYLLDIKDWSLGTITYDGFYYKNVKMMYDQYADEAIILLTNNIMPICLVSEKVTSFDVLGHHFIYLANKNLNDKTSLLKTGFYDELYGGNTQVIARRAKVTQTQNDFQTLVTYFLPVTSYYIYKNGIYYTISSQGDILDVFKDHKKEIQQYAKANKIKYKKDREQAIVKIAAYYDHLTE